MARRPGASSSSTRASTTGVGWMHTSSGVDVVDEFTETIVRRDGRLFYRYGSEERPLAPRTSSSSAIARRRRRSGRARGSTIYRTHHGPIVRASRRPLGRIRADAPAGRGAAASPSCAPRRATLPAFMQVMALQANSSNNTIYADADGNIAYLHPQFIPRRDDRFDYHRPVDGSDPATDWRGLHALGRGAAAAQPAQWLDPEHQQLALVGGRADSPRREAFPALHGHGRRESARRCMR